MTQRQQLMRLILPLQKYSLHSFESLYFVHNTLKIPKACLVSYHTPQVFPYASPMINTKNLTLPFLNSWHGTFSFHPTIHSRLINVLKPKNITKTLYNLQFITLGLAISTVSSAWSMNDKWIPNAFSVWITSH